MTNWRITSPPKTTRGLRRWFDMANNSDEVREEATDNAVSVILGTCLTEEEWDEWVAWYRPEHWFGTHRAAGVFLRAKLRGEKLT
jgi:hypothetical protein